MKVAIIGAGPCGLTSIKCCLDEGLEPVCFEKGTDLGGLWRFTTTEPDHASVYKACVMVTSKEMSCFSDFPIPKGYPLYLPHDLAKAYLNQYADNFDLRPYISYNSKVLKVTHSQKANKNHWKITYEQRKIHDDSTESTETFTQVFDAVLVCSGHHWEANIPELPGADKFHGEIMHSSSFKEAKHFYGKNVLVVGIGDSALAIATELSQVVKKVYLSTRRGSWITSRIQAFGMPSDQFLHRRFFFNLPRRLLDTACMNLVNLKFDHGDFGLLPNNTFLQQPPVVNDFLPYKVISGAVLMRPDISTLTDKDVIFVDGSVALDVDVIILATGYNYSFPFLDEDMVEFKHKSPLMYKHMFRVEENPSIAFIGCLQPVGCMFSVAELQARLATRVFKGLVKLPSTEDMEQDIAENLARLENESYDAKKHATAVYYIPYCNSLAEIIGCKPRLGAMLLTDPHLALRCYFGPCSPPQYRLRGPGAWSGARRAIMEIQERNIAQMKKEVPGTNYVKLIITIVAGLLFLYFMLTHILY
ncbi:dimethylaniline monooxygenase [N-oxide-forming] 2-like [Dendronephthya gigantea]|uniref:dimethylaniline monooxygenase [N-oxide-forming] 2-like n=1 Tax=Dendronephthya gigantea TaxID=151771 RepID=UPI00106ADA7F|nr:dimethylaniline monooxygenase [N-oxide-forming] 2-like [Dendronephthya gigantea]